MILLGVGDIAVGFYVGSMLIFFIIRDVLMEILKLNISKSKYKKVTQKQTLLNHILLSYFKKYINSRQLLFKVFISIYYLYISINLLFLALMLFYIFQTQILKIYTIFGVESIKFFKALFDLKLYLVDIPVLSFLIIKTGHDKERGGIKWKL